MNINESELKQETSYLNDVIGVIRNNLASMGKSLMEKESAQQDFQKFMWDNKAELDPKEILSLQTDNMMDVYFYEKNTKYFRTLFKIQNNPYFGSIIFDENGKPMTIYIGITFLEDDKKQLIYDWRSPICSLFYDYELGPCSYNAPGGIVKGTLTRKRQYNIEDGKLKRVFDNNINIDDELLQEVLTTESSEKMKNIVNTIQQEQNRIIRNTTDKNLIVQGIAGSGKTSVALHRIAFLLYRINNLRSDNILIFSPNQIFTEYISNVLPELGEDNTMQTTFHDFFNKYIVEYKKVESFSSFIARYYSKEETNRELVAYKQSDEIIDDMKDYIEYYSYNLIFVKDIERNNNYFTKQELNSLFHDRYSKLPVFNRIEEMAIRYSEQTCNGTKKDAKVYHKLLLESLGIKKDYRTIYKDFYQSRFARVKLDDKRLLNKESLNFEDAALFVYMKGLLEGLPYNKYIEEVVIDEAQDYSKLQYILLSQIFRNSGFTILGDINQTINPYYKYKSLTVLEEVFPNSTAYLELSKTYRSSEEIISYTNKILDLNHVRAIRKSNNKPVLFRNNENLKVQLLNDINYLQKSYKSIAIITKDDEEKEELYNLIKNDVDIKLLDSKNTTFIKDLIIIPSYIAKGLEFDSVIVYNKPNNKYLNNEKYLYYVACTRAQHELIIYN